MRERNRSLGPAGALLLGGTLFSQALVGGTVDPSLLAAIQDMKPGQPVGVIVSLSDRLPVNGYAPGGAGRHSNAGKFVEALRAKATATQAPILTILSAWGGRSPVSLWAINGIALTIPNEAVRRIALLPGVDTVRLDAVVQGPVTTTAASGPAEWNVQMLRAPDLWAAGYDGTGLVVASLDSGVDVKHPDLGPRYRGGSNSWFDPYGQHSTPADVSGHGTQTMGLIVGGSSGGTAIGMAPGARWIAAKIFNDSGQATLGAIHQAFQWVLDPDGNPATNDSPDIVNNSWGFPSLAGTCYSEFASDVSVLRAAGIEVVFAGGNDGPNLGSSESPASNAGAVSVGAVDQFQTVAPFSSRGPGACDGSVFPKLSAPGVSVRTSDLTFGGVIPNSYATVSGTSFAAPHVAGAVALLWAFRPSATLATLESVLEGSAVDLGILGPDNDYGYGMPDLVAAQALLASLPAPPTANPDSYTATGGTVLSVTAPGVLANDTGPSGRPLAAVLQSGPAVGTLSLAADGSFTYAAPSAAGTYSFTYQVSDGAQWSGTATVTITVQGGSQPPVAAPDSYSATAGTTLAVAAPGVLSNDSSPSGAPLTAALASPATCGTVSLSSNGGFTFVSPAAGSCSFTYTASDGGLSSSPATVTISVQAASQPPVAANDSYAAVAGVTLGVAAPGVLGNDSNPSGAPLTAQLVSGPTKGTLALSANGSFTYKANGTAATTDSFSYKAVAGTLASAPATVTLNVAAHPAPVAVNDAATTARNTAVTVNVLANDYDADGSLNAASVRITSSPSRGTASVKSNGTIVYTPSRNYSGTVTFKYTVKDDLGIVSNQATVTVTMK